MLLSVDSIHVYYGKRQALQGVSLEVEKSEVVAVLGRNGAGKTTTLDTVAGLAKPKSGRIFFKGVDTTSLPAFRIARMGMGYVPQGRRLFPDLTVLENLRTGTRGQLDREILDDTLDLFPFLRDRLGQTAKTLSGGEQQMLAIARALTVKPDLLLLDEPTTGLMPVVVSRLREVIREVNKQGIAILLVEEKVPFAFSVAERVYLMDKCQVAYRGSPEDLQQRKEILMRHLGARI